MTPKNKKISNKIRRLSYVAVENGFYQFYERFDLHLLKLNNNRVSSLDTGNQSIPLFKYITIYLLCNMFAFMVFVIELL